MKEWRNTRSSYSVKCTVCLQPLISYNARVVVGASVRVPIVGSALSAGSPAAIASRVVLPAPCSPRHKMLSSSLSGGGASKKQVQSRRIHCSVLMYACNRKQRTVRRKFSFPLCAELWAVPALARRRVALYYTILTLKQAILHTAQRKLQHKHRLSLSISLFQCCEQHEYGDSLVRS